jgi:hypothetical protein
MAGRLLMPLRTPAPGRRVGPTFPKEVDTSDRGRLDLPRSWPPRVEQPLTGPGAQLWLQRAAVCLTDAVAIENSRRRSLQTDHAATPEEAADRAQTG